MKRIISTLLLVQLSVLCSLLQAQIVKGKVYEITDNMKKELYGVNIYWLNNTIGTTSNADGSFSISKSNKTDKLIFSFVGYNPDTITIRSSDDYIEVVLKDSRILDEVTIGERKVGSHYSRMETMSIQNISGAELCKAACCNLSESFETNASVDASYSDAATGAKQIRLLGLAGKYVQMMTENMPNLYGLSQLYALGYIPGPWMESIQVSKGTSAVINGYEAITGQINIEYKKPKKSDLLFVNQLFSSSGRAETNIDMAIKLNDKWSTMLFTHNQHDLLNKDYNKDGFYDMPKITQYNIFNRWDYMGKNTTIRFGVKYINEIRKGGQINHNFNERLNNNIWHENEAYGIYINSERMEGFYKMGYVFPAKDYQSLAMITNFISQKQNSYFGKTIYNANQYSGYLNLIWQSAFDKHNEEHKYHAGLSLKYENLSQHYNTLNTSEIERIPGLFFQYTGKIFKNINLISGIRADYNNNKLIITPRLNVKYNVTGNLSIRVSAGKGTRKAYYLAENSYFLASSRKISIEENLKLEEAWNFGSNITWYIPIGSRDLAINAEAYHTRFVNQIVIDIEDPRYIKFYNLNGKSYSSTYQIEFSYQLIRGLETNLAFRYNDVKQTISGVLKEAPLTNRYKGIFNLSYKTPLETWQFDFTGQLNGQGRIPSTSSNPINFQRDNSFSTFTLFNLQITKYFKYFEMYLGCENIFNFVQKNPIISVENPYSDYFDSSLIWGPLHGRKFYLGIRFNLAQKNNKKV